MDFADSGAQPNEQHAMSEHKTIFALARVDRASVTRDQDHLRGEVERRPRAPLMLDLTDSPACAGRGPLGVPAQASVPAGRLVSRPTEAATPRARASASPTGRGTASFTAR
jgi:hypothetical protein